MAIHSVLATAQLRRLTAAVQALQSDRAVAGASLQLLLVCHLLNHWLLLLACFESPLQPVRIGVIMMRSTSGCCFWCIICSTNGCCFRYVKGTVCPSNLLHQCLLLLLLLLLVYCVLQVSPEVVRELEQALPRDAKGAAAAAAHGAAAAAAAVVASGAGGRQRIAVESRVGQHVSEDVFNMPPVPMMDED
jgi:Na+-transporting methylmalonyl-CoA/oxaloacetate decarboxylase gamma subunit